MTEIPRPSSPPPPEAPPYGDQAEPESPSFAATAVELVRTVAGSRLERIERGEVAELAELTGVATIELLVEIRDLLASSGVRISEDRGRPSIEEPIAPLLRERIYAAIEYQSIAGQARLVVAQRLTEIVVEFLREQGIVE